MHRKVSDEIENVPASLLCADYKVDWNVIREKLTDIIHVIAVTVVSLSSEDGEKWQMWQ